MSCMLRSVRQAVAVSSRSVASRHVQQRAVALAAGSLRQASRDSSALRLSSLNSRSFSVSARVLGEGSNNAFASKLGEELQYEKETASSEDPDFIKDFKAQGVWKIVDTPGSDEVTLTRSFGNEEIRLMISIADMETSPSYEEPPEAAEAEEDGEGKKADELEPPSGVTSPIRCSICITKNGVPGAINVDALCDEGAFLLENISFYNDTKIGTELTADADWKRRGLYVGPQFEQLDPSVQEEFEAYLVERGVDETLALFIPDYAEWKEQQEYVHWLENLKKFVEA